MSLAGGVADEEAFPFMGKGLSVFRLSQNAVSVFPVVAGSPGGFIARDPDRDDKPTLNERDAAAAIIVERPCAADPLSAGHALDVSAKSFSGDAELAGRVRKRVALAQQLEARLQGRVGCDGATRKRNLTAARMATRLRATEPFGAAGLNPAAVFFGVVAGHRFLTNDGIDRFRDSRPGSCRSGGNSRELSRAVDGDAFLAELNKRGSALDLRAITMRQVYDWRDERLLVGPTRHGRGRGRPLEWRWSESDLETAATLVKLKAAGLRRSDQLASALWLAERPIPIIRLRAALFSEFDRFLKRQRRDLRPPRDIDVKESRARLRRRLGPVDPGLRAIGINHDGGALISAFKLAIGDDTYEGIDLSRDSAVGLCPFDSLLLGMISFIGFPDEVEGAALSAIQSATETEFLQAREQMACVQVLALLGFLFLAAQKKTEQNPPLDRMGLSLEHLSWKLPLFVQVLSGIVRGRQP